MTEISDRELILHYKESQDLKYPGALFERYKHLILSLCYKYLKNREEAQDASQDIYLALVKKLIKHDISNFKSWLYSLSVNHCLGILRSRGNHHSEVDIENIGDEFMENPEWLHLEDEREIKLKALGDCLKDLKEEQRICVELFYLKKKSYREISEMKKMDEKKVKSHIQNGKRNLKLLLEKAGIKGNV